MVGGSRTTISDEQNRALVRRFFEELINQGKLDVADEIYAPDYVNYVPGAAEPMRGAEAEKAYVAAWRAAFPDAVMTIEQLVIEGDTAAVRCTFRGTHRGEFNGLSPTGKTVTMSVANFLGIRDGKIVENRPLFDALALMQQLGASSAPATGAN